MWTRSCRLTDESQENSGIRVKSDDQELTEVGQWRLHSLSSQETLSPWSQHLTTGGSTCNCRVVTGVSESSPLIGQYLCYWAVIGWCQETPARWCWSLPGPDKGCCVQSWWNRFRALLRASGHLIWHEHPPCTTPVSRLVYVKIITVKDISLLKFHKDMSILPVLMQSFKDMK